MKPEQFFAKLFQIRDSIHLAHLSTKSYAQHVALGSFYEEILDLTDTLVESYQGEHGLVEITILASTSESPIPTLEKFLDTLKDTKDVFSDTDYLNIIDEMKTLTKQTLYKLKNLS